MNCRTKKRLRAFTLVEILLVVMIIAVIAAVVIPRFSNAAALARASTLADNLRVVRSQILLFKSQHLGVAPGYPNCDPKRRPTEARFIEQMMQSSTADGEIAPVGTEGYKYGPYFLFLPVNPVNGKTTIEIVPDKRNFPPAADNSHGYIYQPGTMTFKVDCIGLDESGKSFYDY